MLCDDNLIRKQCVKGRYTTKVVVVVVVGNHRNQSHLWLLFFFTYTCLFVFLQILVVVIGGRVAFHESRHVIGLGLGLWKKLK